MFSSWDPFEDLFPIANPNYRTQSSRVPRVSHVLVSVPKRREQEKESPAEFKRTLDLGQFKPENLKVNITGDVLTVEGTQSHKTDTSCYDASFKRVFRVPKGIDPDSLYCRMGEGNTVELGGVQKGWQRSIDIKIDRQDDTKQLNERGGVDKENRKRDQKKLSESEGFEKVENPGVIEDQKM